MIPEIAKLKVGETWGGYWKHADGWMRLYPPGGVPPQAAPEFYPAQTLLELDRASEHFCDDAEEDAKNWADDL